MDDLTQLLNRASEGGRITADQLLPLVYQKLRQVAAEKIRRILIERARSERAEQ